MFHWWTFELLGRRIKPVCRETHPEELRSNGTVGWVSGPMSPKAILPYPSVPRQIEKESTTPALRSALGTEIIPLPKPRTPSGAISCKNPPVCVCPHLQQFSEYRKVDLQSSNPLPLRRWNCLVLARTWENFYPGYNFYCEELLPLEWWSWYKKLLMNEDFVF